MNKITKFLLDKKYFMPIFFLILCIISIFTMPLTRINFDDTKYLPDDMQTTKGLNILYDEFGDNATLSVMVKDLSLQQALEFKAEMTEIENIEQVVWIDDIVLPFKPEHMSEEQFWQYFEQIKPTLSQDVLSSLESYYNEDSDALFSVILSGTDYEQTSLDAIEAIDRLGEVYLTGQAARTYNNIDVTFSETMQAMILVVPLAVVILLLATKSYIMPLIFLLITGVSLLLNMGSNFIFGEISYLTQATAAILQIALTMDYMIILYNRYNKEKETTPDIKTAMQLAVKNSLLPITASSLTTVASFVALMFMRYTIGLDMGLVLSKGILLSFFTVFLLMPSLMIALDKLIEKTTHKTFNLSFNGLFKVLKKIRYVLPAILLAVVVAAGYFQFQNDFFYGTTASLGGEGSRLHEDTAMTEQSFGRQNQLVILAPKSQIDSEILVAEALIQKDYVTSLNCYSLAAMQADELPPKIQKQFLSENYFRMVLNLNVEEEGEDASSAINEINAVADEHFDEYYLLGNSASVLDIKEVTDYDYNLIMAISIALVFIIILFSFKSFLIPLLLVLVIQGSIWLNFAYAYIFSQPLVFIGVIMVSSIQLGATIDYGILLADRYIFFRRSMNKYNAAYTSLEENKLTVIISAAIMSIAGFALSISSSMSGVAIIGQLIGRGALTSGLMVLLLLPQLFMLFDKGLHYTTIKSGFLMTSKNKKITNDKKIEQDNKDIK